EAGETARLVEGMGPDDWRMRSFLEQAGLPETLPADARARAQALGTVTALRCRRPLPPRKEMALVWPASIASPAGKVAGRDQRFDYTVREAFAARFECGRANSKAACDPIQSAWLRFSAPVDRASAL